MKHKDEATPKGEVLPEKVLPFWRAQLSDKIQQLRKTRRGRTKGMMTKGRTEEASGKRRSEWTRAAESSGPSERFGVRAPGRAGWGERHWHALDFYWHGPSFWGGTMARRRDIGIRAKQRCNFTYSGASIWFGAGCRPVARVGRQSSFDKTFGLWVCFVFDGGCGLLGLFER